MAEPKYTGAFYRRTFNRWTMAVWVEELLGGDAEAALVEFAGENESVPVEASLKAVARQVRKTCVEHRQAGHYCGSRLIDVPFICWTMQAYRGVAEGHRAAVQRVVDELLGEAPATLSVALDCG